MEMVLLSISFAMLVVSMVILLLSYMINKENLACHRKTIDFLQSQGYARDIYDQDDS